MRTVFPPIISADTANLIFGKVEEILAINKELFCSLTADKSSKMGQTFLKLVWVAVLSCSSKLLQAPVLKLYSAYCKDYPNAITKFSRKMQEDRFAAFLKVCRPCEFVIN